jgi:hypothetical protein
MACAKKAIIRKMTDATGFFCTITSMAQSTATIAQAKKIKYSKTTLPLFSNKDS